MRWRKFRFGYASSIDAINMIEHDSREALNCFRNKSSKATMVLSGSILECALLNYLSLETVRASASAEFQRIFPNPRRRNLSSNLDDWNLNEMLQVAHGLRIIGDETFRLCDLLRGYRNMIHPSVQIRAPVRPNMQRAQRSLEVLKQALGELDDQFIGIPKPIFVINVSDLIGRLIDTPMNVRNAISVMARNRGLNITIIDSIHGFSDLVHNPPEDAIVINTHGEIVPVRPSENWRDFFLRIGNAVRNHGWVFVSIAGYPFYYSGPDDQANLCERAGLDAFLSVIGVEADCMQPSSTDFTADGLKVIERFDMRGLPHRLFAPRCAIWRGIKPISFLRMSSLHGASAIRMGRGWFVQMGFVSNFGGQMPNADTGEQIIGNLALALALYVVT
jgi:hypothetical protein